MSRVSECYVTITSIPRTQGVDASYYPEVRSSRGRHGADDVLNMAWLKALGLKCNANRIIP